MGRARAWPGRRAAAALVTLPLLAGVVAACTAGPPAPTGLTASGRTGRVVLDWDDGAADLQGYEVSRSGSASGTFTLLTPTPVTSSSFSDGPRPAGVRSHYRVVAVGADGSRSAAATASAVPLGSSFSWSQRGSAATGHYEGASAVVGDRLLVFGGYADGDLQATTGSEAFDPTTGRWSSVASLPTALSHQGIAVDGDRVWLVGGFVGDHPGPSTSEVWVYDRALDAYLPGPSLPVDRGAGTAAIVGRELHFVSGATRTAGSAQYRDAVGHWALDLDAVDLSDPLSWPGWEERAPLPTPRNHLGGAALDGRIYVVGGHHDSVETVQEPVVEVYDPVADTWSRVRDMPAGRGHVAYATTAFEGRLLVAGGMLGGPKTTTAGLVEAYDPASDTWVRLADLPAVRKSVSFAFLPDGAVVAGLGSTAVAQKQTWTGRLTATW